MLTSQIFAFIYFGGSDPSLLKRLQSTTQNAAHIKNCRRCVKKKLACIVESSPYTTKVTENTTTLDKNSNSLYLTQRMHSLA